MQPAEPNPFLSSGASAPKNPFLDAPAGANPFLNGGAAPKKSGGGGLLGFLKKEAAHLNPVPFVKGVVSLGNDVGHALGKTGQNVTNDVAYAATRPAAALGLGGVGGANEKHIGSLMETPDYNSHTGKVGFGLGSVADAHPGDLAKVVDAEYPALSAGRKGVVITGKEIAHPSQALANYKADPLGALINDAGTVALFAGPAEGALKAAGAEGTAAKLAQVSEAAGKVINPLHVPGALARKLPGVSDLLDAGAAHQSAANEIAHARMVEGSKAADMLKSVHDNLPADGADPAGHAAALLSAQGAGPVLAHLADNPVAQHLALAELVKMGVHPDIAPAALDKLVNGETPGVEGIKQIAQDRQERELAGYGQAPGLAPAVSEAMTRPEPILSPKTDALVEKAMPKAAPWEKDAAAKDMVEAAPAQYRPALTLARNVIAGLGKAADAQPEHAADLARIAAEIEPLSHLEHYQGEGVDQPTHIIGAKADEMEAGAPKGGGAADKIKAVKASFNRQGNQTLYTPEGARGLEERNITTATRNEVVKKIDAMHTTTAADTLGADASRSGKEIVEAMHAAGFKSWDPTGFTHASGEVPANLVDEHTKWLPKAVHDELTRAFKPTIEDPTSTRSAGARVASKIYNWLTNNVYRGPLAVSPSYLTRRIVGNAFLAHVNGDISLPDLARRGAEAIRMLHAHEAPAAFNDARTTTLNDATGGSRLFKKATVLPRLIDKASRVAVYIDQLDKNGGDPHEAVARANEVMGDLNRLGPAERATLGRVFPIYSWMKAVVEASSKYSDDHPGMALQALNVSSAFQKNPAAFSGSSPSNQLNPFDVFGISGGGAVNPFVRGAVGATTGFNLATLKPISRPPGDKTSGPLGAGEDPYYLGSQLPIGKIIEQSPLSALTEAVSGGGLHPIDQNVGRYQTGQIRLKNGKPEPALSPVTHTPAGDFGSYFRSFLGNAVPFSAAPTAAQAKAAKAATKSADTYAREVARARAKGIR